MFFQEVDKTNPRAMFEFLNKHPTYFTLNSWNGLKSIAQNVKLYNLPLRHSVNEALEALNSDDYFTINQKIYEWEDNHPGFGVGFNGRSCGYLVLYKNNISGNALVEAFHTSPVEYASYENWEEDVIDRCENIADYMPQLIEQVELVQDFDKLCDELTEEVDRLCD